MNKTFVYVMDIDCRFSAVSPYHLPCFSEVFLIVGKDNKIVEGSDGTARRKGEVGDLSSWFRAGVRVGHVDVVERDEWLNHWCMMTAWQACDFTTLRE
jgi:hypothetical protein